jgi:competence protein ComEA
MPPDGRIWAVVFGAVALAAVLLAPRLVPGAAGGDGKSGASREGVESSRPALVQSAVTQTAVVHVAGAVRHPGVYRMKAGARVRDAVRRAGGAGTGADLDAINLAAKVADGQQVVVPARGGSKGAGGPAQVSLGSATAEELDTLDGVGPVMAEKIVEWRSTKGGVGSVDELDQIPGIGPKKLEALRGQLVP